MWAARRLDLRKGQESGLASTLDSHLCTRGVFASLLSISFSRPALFASIVCVKAWHFVRRGSGNKEVQGHWEQRWKSALHTGFPSEVENWGLQNASLDLKTIA